MRAAPRAAHSCDDSDWLPGCGQDDLSAARPLWSGSEGAENNRRFGFLDVEIGRRQLEDFFAATGGHSSVGVCWVVLGWLSTCVGSCAAWLQSLHVQLQPSDSLSESKLSLNGVGPTVEAPGRRLQSPGTSS